MLLGDPDVCEPLGRQAQDQGPPQANDFANPLDISGLPHIYTPLRFRLPYSYIGGVHYAIEVWGSSQGFAGESVFR